MLASTLKQSDCVLAICLALLVWHGLAFVVWPDAPRILSDHGNGIFGVQVMSKLLTFNKIWDAPTSSVFAFPEEIATPRVAHVAYHRIAKASRIVGTNVQLPLCHRLGREIINAHLWAIIPAILSSKLQRASALRRIDRTLEHVLVLAKLGTTTIFFACALNLHGIGEILIAA